jgi:hypothetical protein
MDAELHAGDARLQDKPGRAGDVDAGIGGLQCTMDPQDALVLVWTHGHLIQDVGSTSWCDLPGMIAAPRIVGRKVDEDPHWAHAVRELPHRATLREFERVGLGDLRCGGTSTQSQAGQHDERNGTKGPRNLVAPGPEARHHG